VSLSRSTSGCWHLSFPLETTSCSVPVRQWRFSSRVLLHSYVYTYQRRNKPDDRSSNPHTYGPTREFHATSIAARTPRGAGSVRRCKRDFAQRQSGRVYKLPFAQPLIPLSVVSSAQQLECACTRPTGGHTTGTTCPIHMFPMPYKLCSTTALLTCPR
jgi:hypothetical protein